MCRTMRETMAEGQRISSREVTESHSRISRKYTRCLRTVPVTRNTSSLEREAGPIAWSDAAPRTSVFHLRVFLISRVEEHATATSTDMLIFNAVMDFARRNRRKNIGYAMPSSKCRAASSPRPTPIAACSWIHSRQLCPRPLARRLPSLATRPGGGLKPRSAVRNC
jgi:hypothetical protein